MMVVDEAKYHALLRMKISKKVALAVAALPDADDELETPGATLTAPNIVPDLSDPLVFDLSEPGFSPSVPADRLVWVDDPEGGWLEHGPEAGNSAYLPLPWMLDPDKSYTVEIDWDSPGVPGNLKKVHLYSLNEDGTVNNGWAVYDSPSLPVGRRVDVGVIGPGRNDWDDNVAESDPFEPRLMLEVRAGTKVYGITVWEGDRTFGDFVETDGTVASGAYSHAEGYDTSASGTSSHTEGRDTTASGSFSHAEGTGTSASGSFSHAEGYDTTASGAASHAEGYNTTASGDYSHAEGNGTSASGAFSHARGGGLFDYIETVPGVYDKGLGQSQYLATVLSGETTDETPTTFAVTSVVLAPERAAGIRGLVTARQLDGSAMAAWTATGLVEVDAAGAVTLHNVTFTQIGSKGTVTGWTPSLVPAADSAVQLAATGAASTTIHWSATIEAQEVY